MKENKQLELQRHSMAHVMASAIQKLYPQAKFGIGPTIENGFYYDIELPEQLTPGKLPKIQKQMKKIIAQNFKFEKKEMKIDDAIKMFQDLKQDYKVKLLKDLQTKGSTKLEQTAENEVRDGKITIYKTGEFVDLCRGPHVASTGELKHIAFKLNKIAGAYWRGDEKNNMLTRIYAIAFESQEKLDEHLNLIAEAEKRDHRKLGKELDLFSFHEEAPGMPFWHNKGVIVWNELVSLWREIHKKAGYEETKTPIILNKKLWETSGHWENYRENMYLTKIDEEDYAIKPMNCPGGMLLYKNKPHSYKELPLRVGELGLVHRHELSGVLSGLFRVRAFTQDDAHIFMTREQIKDEIIGVLELVDKMYSIFGFKYHLELSTRPKKSIGSDEAWDMATQGLKKALDSTGRKYKINKGDGAFYGPKIDVHLEDALGRTWQCATIQLDMNLPERFDLIYIDDHNQKQRPVMIHRVIYGSIERFLGILVEHYAGKFPVWLAPVQVKIIAVGGGHVEYCQKLAKEFEAQNIRIEIDSSDETVGKKIRNAIKEKVPYMLVIGDKEMKSKKLHIRQRNSEDVTEIKKDKFIKHVKELIETRSSEL